MTGWIWFLIALPLLLIVGMAVARRIRPGVPATGHDRRDHLDDHPKPNFEPLQTAGDWRADTRKDPNLEYQGEVYFFSSVEERDRCTAHLVHGECRPDEASKTPRAIDRRH